jgi:hypothetical protein
VILFVHVRVSPSGRWYFCRLIGIHHQIESVALFFSPIGRMSFGIAILIGWMLCAMGCVDSWEGPPHFLHVPSVDLMTDEDEGTNSQRIEEIWVYTETDVLGAFPLPADIPLSPEQLGPTASLVLLAGIRANAVSATRQPYPFYDAIPVELALDYGGRDTMALELGYTEQTQVILAEDFESANRFVVSNTSTAQVVRTDDLDEVFEGVGSGFVELSAEAQVLIATTNEQQYDLSTSGPVWLEMDYRCTQPFAVGLQAVNEVDVGRIPILVLKATGDEWNKIYLDLGPIVRSTPDANHYEITLDAVFDNSDELTFLFFDNFKLLRYP